MNVAGPTCCERLGVGGGEEKEAKIGAFLREVTMDTILLARGWQLALDL